MRVIGTAGHVDHGKSTLVEALTGTHPDRLKEEREREMTIDLGFAWLTLPNGEEVGIVDVPGHRDFIENMLSGIGGIDAALLVIAADEGIMPQTREHLAILDLLQVQAGIVVLNKVDLVRDDEWLELVEDEIRQVLRGTILESAPIVRVSARRREGMQELLEALDLCLQERPTRSDLGRPRLPIDRVFTIQGFGTVVTGTLVDGELRVGDEIAILPRGSKGRVRGLQTHKRKEEVAVPGSRTAVNISGVNLEEVERGDVVAHPNDYQPTGRLDVQFRLLPDASITIKHNTSVKLFLGATEVVARLRLIGVEALNPSEEGWLQLETAEKVVAVRNDRYILRRLSPGETLGGGFVIDPHPKGRHRRFNPATLEHFKTLAKGSPAEIFLQAVNQLGVAQYQDVAARTNLNEASAKQAFKALVDSTQVFTLSSGELRREHTANIPKESLIVSKGYWDQFQSRLLNDVEAYHRSNPLKRGMPKEELKSKLRVAPRFFNLALERLVYLGFLKEVGPLITLPSHQIRFTAHQQKQVDGLIEQFKANEFSPPSVKECLSQVGEQLYSALIEMGLLVQVSPEVVYNQEGYQSMVTGIKALIESQGLITAAQVRDHFNTSRKYALALLEHLDSIGVTIREGDSRRLRKSAS